ncbi:hypothetical protein N1Z63_006161 [Pseudomonas aeruginosa]
MEDELRLKLESSALDGGRSLHAEIIRRLENSFKGGNASSVETENNAMLKAICAQLGIKVEC